MAGGFTSLSIGVSGLKASQNAINTTAHNLANVNTTGYVRQQAVFADTSYQTIGRTSVYVNQIGIGVDLAEVRRVRDELLDKAFRQESGRMEFYESQQKAIEEIEEVFGELEGVAFQDYLEDLRTALQEVVKEPASQVTRAGLIQSSVAFITRANTIYENLVNYQDTLNKQVINYVNRINELGDTIHDLNQRICKAEAGDIENANDLRDQRDNALDELSTLVNISYTEDSSSRVTVKVEGVNFVNDTSVYHMDVKMLDADKDSELVTPVWPHLVDNPVFNLQVPVSTKSNTDIGGLKGILLARGNCTANYTDIPIPDDYEGGVESEAYKLALKRWQHDPALFDEPDAADYVGGRDSKAFQDDLQTYREDIEQSSVKTVMAEFDQMINAIVESINDILCPNVDAEELQTRTGETLIGEKYIDNSGKEREITENTLFFDAKNAGYGCATNSEVQGTELFVRNGADRYQEIQINGNTYYVFNDYNVFGNEALYTVGELEVNPEVLQDYTLIPLSTKDGGEDRERAEALGEAWDNAELKLTPDYNTQKKFMEYYTEFTGQVANAGKMYDNMIDYQENLTNGIDEERQRITGVSSDDELTNLIKFQAAYNASSRYINVIDEMLEHLIMRL